MRRVKSNSLGRSFFKVSFVMELSLRVRFGVERC